MLNDWIIVICMILFSAFFSGMEIAFVTSNRLKIELDKNKGLLSGKIFSSFSKKSSDFIAALLVGNNIALVIYGIYMAGILIGPISRILPESLNGNFSILIVQTVLSTLLILLTAEFLPKVLFRINPNYILHILAVPAAILYYLLFPIVFITIHIAEFLLQILFKVKIPEEKRIFGPVDLDNYLKEFFPDARTDQEMEHEIQIFQNAMEFPSIKLRECMVPRTEIVGVENDASISELKQAFIENGLSKILIYSGTIDNIIGYAHHYDIFKNPENIASIMRPISFVPESMLASNLLSVFIEEHKSIAVVVDEFGGTSGILTMEDVIEEIFGEINDEFDVEALVEKQINEKEFVFSGRLEIDYLNEKYHLNLPESDDYETLTGFIFHHHQSIPKLHEEIIINTFVITITKAAENKIDQINLRINQ